MFGMLSWRVERLQLSRASTSIGSKTMWWDRLCRLQHCTATVWCWQMPKWTRWMCYRRLRRLHRNERKPLSKVEFFRLYYYMAECVFIGSNKSLRRCHAQVVLANISVLLPLLDVDCYPIRQVWAWLMVDGMQGLLVLGRHQPALATSKQW